jgi:uncharacterized protein (TIGR03118 family)
MGGQTVMKLVSGGLFSAAVIAVCLITVSTARADDKNDQLNRYVVTNLTSNQPGVAPNTDPVLQNAWGVTFTPGASPFWISDNTTGCSTLYDGTGAIASTLQVKIPLPNGDTSTACQPVDPKHPPKTTPAAPTGVVWNPTSTFLVPHTTSAAIFIFDTEDGTISAWTGGLTQAAIAVDNSGSGAVYKA